MSLSDAARVAIHIRQALASRDPRWWGSRQKGADPGHLDQPLTWLKTHHLLGVRADSQDGLIGWLEGRYPLRLRHDIPTPLEMLNIQCAGERYVTLLVQPEWQSRDIGRHKGALAFLLHDLEHAEKFFGETHHLGQVCFFRMLRASLPRLETYRQRDPKFAAALDYLMSDMNSHPLHLLKYFKAIVLQMLDVSLDKFCDELFDAWGMSQDCRDSARKINYPGQETLEDQQRVTDFFCLNTSLQRQLTL